MCLSNKEEACTTETWQAAEEAEQRALLRVLEREASTHEQHARDGGLWSVLQGAARAVVEQLGALRGRLTETQAALTEARSQPCATCPTLRQALAQVVCCEHTFDDVTVPVVQGADDQRRLRSKLQAARAALTLAKQQLEQQQRGPSSVVSGSPVQPWGHGLVHAAVESQACGYFPTAAKVLMR